MTDLEEIRRELIGAQWQATAQAWSENHSDHDCSQGPTPGDTVPCHVSAVYVAFNQALNILARHERADEPPKVWSGACAPGGYVCAVADPGRPDGICGMPVESEPCTRHAAAADGV